METPAYCLPNAVSDAVNVNNSSQIITAEDLINDVAAYMPLTISWSGELSADEQQYYIDTMSASMQNPAGAAQTAVDYAKYTQASAAMSAQTGALSNLIESEKMAVSYETSSVKQEYGLVSSLTQFTQLYCMLLRLKQ